MDMSIIPQAFYDLIGRVIPGATALLAIMAALPGSLSDRLVAAHLLDGTSTSQKSSVLCVIIFLAASYVVGHLLVPINDGLRKWSSMIDKSGSYGHQLHKMTKMLAQDVPKDDTNLRMRSTLQELVARECRNPDELSDETYGQLLFLWYDRLRVDNSEVGDRLTKLRAEHEMHRGLAAALLVALCLYVAVAVYVHWHGYDAHYGYGVHYAFGLLLIAGLFVSWLGIAKTRWRLQVSIINHYYLRYGGLSDTKSVQCMSAEEQSETAQPPGAFENASNSMSALNIDALTNEHT